VPPEVVITFVTSESQSPDTLNGFLYAFDADGLRRLQLQVRTSDSAFGLDTLEVLALPTELNRGLTIHVPAGRPAGSILRLVARVTDGAGFAAADSTDFTVR
jgi:hypothetical protein